MLHRFAVPDEGIPGHDAATLAKSLEYLRRNHYTLVSVMDLVHHLKQGTPLRRNTVAFTVDDGYSDFASVASPVFAAYDCPVTVFLVTDFVAGRTWNWYDRVEWSFEHSSHSELMLQAGNESFVARWSNASERGAISNNVVERLKRMPDAQKENTIDRLASALEVEVSTAAPSRYRAMDWAQVRACGKRGATFGPHTLTHPILSQVPADRAASEISESWRAVSAETDAAVPVFCYPNGTAADFSSREESLVARAGMHAAVSAIEGCVVSSPRGAEDPDLFVLPRFAYSEKRHRFVQIASGLEQLKTRFRRRSQPPEPVTRG